MIVGGLDSPGGAVIGGLLIGLITSLVAGYQSDYFPWLGEGFSNVAPYVVMVLILLVRPYGLFGTPEVRRV
jgi:branched-chain amino acid transport system permease protein